MGTTLLPNLTLEMGDNVVEGTALFKVSFPFSTSPLYHPLTPLVQPNDTPQARATLNEFVGMQDVPLSIAGYGGSTDVRALQEAFEALDVDVVLPGLNETLLRGAGLTSEWWFCLLQCSLPLRV